ncbi:MAG: enolase C-terminal domain-like protein, partial [Candidatus Firestonebacteria bacterium]
YAQVKVTVENRKGDKASGWGAIPLSDFWAFPTKNIDHLLKEKAMIDAVKGFCKIAANFKGYAHPVRIFVETEKDLPKLCKEVTKKFSLTEEYPFLAGLVSTSCVDAAVHDAFGKVNKISSYDGFGKEHMDDLSNYLGPKFTGKYIGDSLLKKYKTRVSVFHLVGGLDKLTVAEIDETDVKDSVPVTLDEWIKRDKVFNLKIKLKGSDLKWDLDRTKAVARIAHENHVPGRKLCFSADTNEQCESPEYIIEYLSKLKEEDRRAFDEILYIEQPTERELRGHKFDMKKLSSIKPVIIDESLMTLEDFDLAMELNWSGIALKTCKCVSMELLMICKAAEKKIVYTLQDLTNPGLSLLQAVGFAARINTLNSSVEINARQFYPAFSEPEAKIHPRICEIRDGYAYTDTLKGYGLGYQIEKIDREINKK